MCLALKSFLYGCHFVLQTDHKPLLALFSNVRAVSPQVSGRIQRWSLLLSSYEYSITSRQSQQHANADALSRLSLPEAPTSTVPPPEVVFMMDCVNDSPVTARQIALWTRRNTVLSRVAQFIQEGWPCHVDEQIQPYWRRRLELSLQDSCILWGSRVVIPPQAQEHLLAELHGGHPGVSRMKGLAHSLLWWPGLDGDIKSMVKQCNACQQHRPDPAPVPLHPWSWPTKPWTRLHLDFAGPFQNTMFLIIVDAHSKWLEIAPLEAATVTTTQARRRVS